jgi:hypothetical protein
MASRDLSAMADERKRGAKYGTNVSDLYVKI